MRENHEKSDSVFNLFLSAFMGNNLSCPVNSAAEEPRTKPSPGLTLAEAIAQALFRWWKEEVELLCDEIAIQRATRPLDLAEALFRIRKAMLGRKDAGIQAILQSAFLHPVPSTFVERRIRNILRFCDQDTARHQVASPPASPLLSLVAFASFSFLLLSLLELWLDPLFLHCQLERIIRCLV
jgi:hypothetical protein